MCKFYINLIIINLTSKNTLAMRFFLIIAIFFMVLNQFTDVNAHINATTYYKIPPLYKFDNYDQCLMLQPFSVYCVVFAEIETYPNNEIWLEIKNKSNDLMHNYRHENLFFGICIERCKNLLEFLTPLEIVQLSRNKSLQNEITDYYQSVHKRAGDKDDRLIYQHMTEICLNYEFFRKYNLTLTTSIEYCENSKRSKNFASILLTSFSICRNYYRITSPTAKNKDCYESDLKFTYAFRVFTLFIVILGHCIMTLMAVQIQNPEFIENSYHQPYSIIFQNGAALIQIFFVLAGFLLKLKFDQYKMVTANTTFFKGAMIYIHCFINRYLRLIPSLVMVILFNGTLLIYLQNGPFWRHMVEAEYVFCREYWWKNIFMINNFMLKESCSHHTWFLAADMQLFELFLFTVILTAKFRNWKNSLYILYGTCASLVPGIITYLYELDAIHYLRPENYRYLYFKDVDTFYLTYPQFYCNMGGYLVGFICAEVYMKFIRSANNKKIKNITKYRSFIKAEILLLIVIFLIGFGLLFSGLLVIKTNIEKPSMWLSLYASLYRNLWSIFGGLILLYMLLKMGWIAYEIACLPIFQILGKISFQTYLWHVTVLRLLEGYYRQPVYLNNFFMICQIVLAFFITNVVAFFMALLVEYPIGEIIRYILKPQLVKNIKDDYPSEMKPHLKQIHI